MAYLVFDAEDGKMYRVQGQNPDDALKRYVQKSMGSAADEADIAAAIETFNGEVYDEANIKDVDAGPAVPTMMKL